MNILAYYSYLLAALVVLAHVVTRNPYGLQHGVPLHVAAIASAVLLLLGKIFALYAQRRRQRRRDRRAATLLARLLETPGRPAPPYVVYLRPFSTTGRLTVTNPKPRWLPVLPSYFAHEATLEFETMLAEALPDKLPLVALGRPGEHVGAGRIAVSDEDWKGMFQRLIDSARWIVMIPSGEGETRWELQQLFAQDLLRKTIFVMPPALKKGGIDVAAYWAQVREIVATDGVQLPPYIPAGQLFQLGRQGGFYRSRYLPRLTREELCVSLAGFIRG